MTNARVIVQNVNTHIYGYGRKSWVEAKMMSDLCLC